jgi:hypothetical protein
VIKSHEIVRACTGYWGREKRIQGFGGEARGKETTWNADGRIILKWNFKK